MSAALIKQIEVMRAVIEKIGKDAEGIRERFKFSDIFIEANIERMQLARDVSYAEGDESSVEAAYELMKSIYSYRYKEAAGL